MLGFSLKDRSWSIRKRGLGFLLNIFSIEIFSEVLIRRLRKEGKLWMVSKFFKVVFFNGKPTNESLYLSRSLVILVEFLFIVIRGSGKENEEVFWVALM